LRNQPVAKTASPKTPIGQATPKTIEGIISSIAFFGDNPQELLSTPETDLVAFLRGIQYELWNFADKPSVTVAPFESNEYVENVLGRVSDLVKKATPGTSHRLVTTFGDSFRPWARNEQDLPQIHLPEKATPREVFDAVDAITDHVSQHPRQLESGYDALVDPILEWYDDGSRSRSSKRSSRAGTPRVHFDLPEAPETPENASVVSETSAILSPTPVRIPSQLRTPSPTPTPAQAPAIARTFSIPTGFPPGPSARTLAAEERRAVLELYPDFDLKSEAEKEAIREQRSNSPDELAEQAEARRQARTRALGEPTAAERALADLLIRDISPRR